MDGTTPTRVPVLHRVTPTRAPCRRYRKAPRRHTWQVCLEPLEERTLLSTTASILSAPPFSPNGDGVQDTTTIQLQYAGATPGATQVGIAVANQSGKVVYQSPSVADAQGSDTVTFQWDGKDSQGHVVADGTYKVLPVLNGNLFLNSPSPVVVDTAPPSVALGGTADGALVSNTVPLSVTASAEVPISKAEIYFDKSTTPVAQASFSPLSHSWIFYLPTNGYGKIALPDGDHTWYANVTDVAGNSAVSATRTLHVDTSPPQLTLTNPGLGILGETHYTITGTVSDQPALPGYGVASVQIKVLRAADNTQLSAGTATLTGSNPYTWSYAYTPTEASRQVVLVEAFDAAGNDWPALAVFTVDHRPVVNLTATASGSEGTALTLMGSVTDPDGVSPPDGWTATVNYGDSTVTHNLALNPDKTFDLSHVYQTSGTFPITVTVTDKYGVSGKATVTATVAHVPPTNLTLTPSQPEIKENGSVTLGGNFTAPGNDTHTVTINWGDGSTADTVNLGAGVQSFHKAHQYLSEGHDSISVTVADGAGGTVSGSAAVKVDDVAPSNLALLPGATTISEGDSVSLSGSFLDPGTKDSHTVTINWGDGSSADTVSLGAGVLSFGGDGSVAHTYQAAPSDGSPYRITVTVADDGGGSTKASTRVAVQNVVPVPTINVDPNSLPAQEGWPITLGSTVDDPNPLRTFTYQWSVTKDGQPFDLSADGPTDAPALTFTPTDEGHYVVSLEVTDDLGASNVTSYAFDAADVPPAMTVSGPDHIAEGSPYTLSLGPVIDPAPTTVSQYTVHWGDGSSNNYTPAQVSALDGQVQHTYAQGPNSYAITVDLTTEDGANPDVAAQDVTVDHVGPSNLVLTPGATTVNEGDSATLSGTFTAPGTQDTHTVAIDWGDGSKPDVVKLGAGVLAFGAGGSVKHTYLNSPPGGGPYTVNVTVADKEGGVTQGSTSLTVKDVAPSGTTLKLDKTTVDEGGKVTLSGGFTDPGTRDTHTVTVNWGDGSRPDVFNLGAGVLDFSQAHYFRESGTDSIMVTVAPDDGGGTDQARTQVTVKNVAPSGTTLALDRTTINAGGTVALHGRFVDPGPTDTHTVTIDWGDGSKPTTLSLGAGVVTFGADGGVTHTYQTSQKNNARYTITATVTDEEGATNHAGTQVLVKHGPPTDFTVQLDKKTVPEGGTVNLSGSFTDPGTQDGHTATISWGDGSTDTVSLAAGVLTFTKAHHYLKDGTDHVAVTVADTAGGTAVNSTNVVTVKDVAPSGTILKLDRTTIDSGGKVTLSGTFTDPAALDTHTVTINWGDGSKPEVVKLGAGVLTFSQAHRFLGSGTDRITVTVADGKDGGSDHAGTQVTIKHVPPTGTTLKLDKKSISEGGKVTLSGSFAAPGTPEAHTVTINWGDGSTPETLKLAAGVLTFGRTHHYLDSRPGNAPYTITATVSDNAGGSSHATIPVTVKAVAPTAYLSGPTKGVVGQALSYTGSFKDWAPSDKAGDSFAWKVMNATGQVLQKGSQLNFSFTPTAPGKYVVSFRVTDNDGGTRLVAKSVTITTPPLPKTAAADGLALAQLGTGGGSAAGGTDPGSPNATGAAPLFQSKDWGRLF
jgi:hypothetical protein